jgi:hypothetical protein
VDLSRVVWRKAERSTSNGGECVEVASLPEIIAVRDSKDPSGPVLPFSSEKWRSFTEGLKNL